MHETSREFFIRHYAFTKTTAIQVLRSSHHFVQLPAMVLQTHPFGVFPQIPWQNAKKGSHIDSWSIQDLSNRRN